MIRMNVIDLIKSSAWAILPDRLDVINGVVARHMAGLESPDAEKYAAAARAAAGTEEDDRPYTVTGDGAAIIPVTGILAKRMNLFMAISGGTSTEMLASAVRQAVDDDEVEAMVLRTDSPGGTVDGTKDVADIIYSARQHKPVVSYADGLMASAGYWIGSAAHRVVTGETGEVGSIGVIMKHYDWSAYNEERGLKVTNLYAGKYKAMGNQDEPLTEEAVAYLQGQVDYLYTLFVDAVAVHRGTDAATVIKQMAEGRIFIGRQALDAGLVDEIGTLETAVQTALDLREGGSIYQILMKEGAMTDKKTDKAVIKTVADLRDALPEMVEQIETDAVSGVDVGKAEADAAQGERERIIGLAGVQFGAEDAGKLEKIVNSGVTVEQFEAVSALGGSREQPAGGGNEAEILAELKRAGAENPGAGGGEDKGASGKDFETLVTEYRFANKCGKADAIRAVATQFPAAHEAYLQKANQ
jgi:signal peptide peptidase SppA